MSHKWFNASIAVVAAVAVVGSPVAFAEQVSFKDVNASTEQGEAIQILVEKGIISGYKDGTFRPSNSVTRAQAAKIIAGVLEFDLENVKDPGFSDVSKDHANYSYIAALANLKILSGSNGKFNPNAKMTRGQMAKVLAIAFEIEGSTNTPFKDVKTDEAKKYVGALFENGITKGKSEEKYGINDPVTRGNLAVFVKRAMELEQNKLPKLVKVDGKMGHAKVSLALEEGQSLKYRLVPHFGYTPLYTKGSKAPADLMSLSNDDTFIPWISKVVQLYKVDANDQIIDGYQLKVEDFKNIATHTFNIINNVLTYKSIYIDTPIQTDTLYFANNGQVLYFSKTDLLNYNWKKDENGIPTLEIQLPTGFKYDNTQTSAFFVNYAHTEHMEDTATGHLNYYVDENLKNKEQTLLLALKQMGNNYVDKEKSHAERTFIGNVLRDVMEKNDDTTYNFALTYLEGEYIKQLQQNEYNSYKEVYALIRAVNETPTNKIIIQKARAAEQAVIALYNERYREMPMFERLLPSVTKEDVLAAEKLIIEVDQYEYESSIITYYEMLLQEAKVAIGLSTELDFSLDRRNH